MADPLDGIVWLDASGNRVSCVEKLAVLHEAMAELRQVAQDAFEDALVIGCAEPQIRQVLAALIASLENPYRSSKE